MVRSTCTALEDGRLVPWLAASGPLAYTPESPPVRDYWFQYSWILPGIFAPTVNKRRHYYFGARYKDDAPGLFAFWQEAREGRAIRVACHHGRVGTDAITAPLAVYSVRDHRDRSSYLLMQHGSYQLVPVDDQPLLRAGELVLYRGINKSEAFRFLRVDRRGLDAEQRRVWRAYVKTQGRMLSDSVLSFNTIHDRAKRCETGHIQDETWISDEIAEADGLEIEGKGFAAALWRFTHQSFSLCRWVAENKFGPHFVTCKTPIGNVRITTFFAGEHEVRVIDPDRVEVLEVHGCRVERIHLDLLE